MRLNNRFTAYLLDEECAFGGDRNRTIAIKCGYCVNGSILKLRIYRLFDFKIIGSSISCHLIKTDI